MVQQLQLEMDSKNFLDEFRPLCLFGKPQFGYWLHEETCEPYSTIKGVPRKLACSKNKYGYISTKIGGGKHGIRFELHRAVGQSFLPMRKPDFLRLEIWDQMTDEEQTQLCINYHVVNHKDEDKTNFHWTNLNWLTSRENARWKP